MREVQTVAYQTTDGQVFTDKRDACTHELLIECIRITADYNTENFTGLRDALKYNAKTLAPLLTELAK